MRNFAILAAVVGLCGWQTSRADEIILTEEAVAGIDFAPGGVPFRAVRVLGAAAAGQPAAKSDGKAKPADAPVQPAPDAPPADPDTVIVTLAEGSKFAGKLNLKEIKLETSFGVLTIPYHRVLSITPGLNSRSDLGKKVTTLINQMGSTQYSERESAEKELLALGEVVREEIQRNYSDKQPERTKALRKIVEKLDEQRVDIGDESAAKSRSWNRLDEIVTPQFKAAGRITPAEFEIVSKFGKLNVRLADIQVIERPRSGPTEFVKKVRVEGTTHLVQRGKLNTGLTIQKGDKVTIKAEGSLTMSPWGDEMSSTPDGDGNQYGWYIDGQIPSGCLLGTVGSSGQAFKVGANHNFVAKVAGPLHLAIGMQAGVSGSNFAGGYNVTIKVERATGAPVTPATTP